jgi:ribonuclease P protein component
LLEKPDLVGVGFVVSKRLGNAVCRNSFKRIVRGLFSDAFIKNKVKIAVIISPKTLKLKKEEVVKSFAFFKENYDKKTVY